MKKTYICGPMRGYPKHNFPAFDEAARRLTEKGWVVINPADFDREIGINEDVENVSNVELRQCMQRDLCAIIGECSHIALLPGWERSRGAQVEAMLGVLLDLKLFNANTGQEITHDMVRLVIGRELIGDSA